MLLIHYSNQLEKLASALLASYEKDDHHPFIPQTIICETGSLARWIKNQFCLHTGISCLVETPFPADWLWSQAHQSLSIPGENDALTREPLQWRIFAALADDAPFRAQDEIDEINVYLNDDSSGLKRWQLAGRIADNFDRYQYYRPQLIRDWSTGNDNNWQARLWQSITADIKTHRVALMDQFLTTLNNTKPEELPSRIDLFSIHNLPPLLLQAFDNIARHTAVHLWALAPTPEYWADLNSPREMATRRRDKPEDISLWQTGNPLLTQWGRQGQIFQDLLLDDALSLSDASEHFVEPERDSLLHQIQADIHDAINNPAVRHIDINSELPQPSIQFHICHGPLRECQVLHDTLLHCLRADKTLQPEDILVLVPEINRYASYIEAVFGSVADNTRIPYNISDVIRPDEYPLISAFLDLLNLPESRFTRAEVLGLANIPEVRQQFGLDESDMAELTEMFNKLRIFWGFNGNDKQHRHLPAIDENTWHQGRQRIMAGFATGSEDLLTAEPPIAPAARITAQSANRAARFFDLLDTLKRWSNHLQKPAKPGEWAERLSNLLDEMFTRTGEDDERLERIREAIKELKNAEASGVQTLELDVIRHWLNKTLDTRIEKGRFYSGGITFCAMKPLRGVPFRVITLLGMQEPAFPRHNNHNEFDLMKNSWRHGDPNPVQEDRYLFLEALLAARDRFIVSYTGRSAKNNEPLQPSVLVQELLDYLNEHYSFNGCKPDEKLVRTHPLHPFSPGNFTDTVPAKNRGKECSPPAPIPSFDHRWLNTAKAIHQHQQAEDENGWPGYTIDPPEHFERRITPRELARFFKSPVKQFVNKRLRLYEPQELKQIEDEPFNLDQLETWGIRNLLIQSWVQENTNDTVEPLARARGMLLHGTQGKALFARIQGEFDTIRERCNENNITPPLTSENIDIDLQLAVEKHRWQLAGRITDIYLQHGLLEISASKYSLTKLLPLWIKHLCLHASGYNPEGIARFIGLDKTVTLNPVPENKAKKYLSELLALYEAGLVTPLSFPESTSVSFIEKLNVSDNKEDAFKEAQKKWVGGFKQYAECEDFHNRIILHAHQWQPDDAMADMARLILNPVTQYLSKKS